MNKNYFFPIVIFFFFSFLGCYLFSLSGEVYLTPRFKASQFKYLAVLNLDPQIKFAEYVEAELIRKGYAVKEEALFRQMLKKEGITKEESLSLEELAKIGRILNIQGIVFCRVLDFSRFRDFYRLQIKMVSTENGNTIWVAQGSMEGKRGEKPGDILKQIVASALKDLPEIPASGQ
jgi:hypothetical protein